MSTRTHRLGLLFATALLAATVAVVAGPATPAGAGDDPVIAGPGLAIRGLDNAVWVRTSPPGSDLRDLSDWYSLGGQTATAPAMAHDRVVIRGVDGQIWVRINSPAGSTSWSDWQALGGATTDDPVVNHDGAVFIRGLDGAVWMRYYHEGSYYPWVSLGGSILGPPAVTAGDLVAVRGADNGVYVNAPINAKFGDYHGWVATGGSTTDTPATKSNPDDVLVAVRGLDGAGWGVIVDDTTGAPVGSWVTIGGRFVGSPVLTGDVVIVRSAADLVYVGFPDTQSWTPTSTRFVDRMSASDAGVFGRGADNQPYVLTDGSGGVPMPLGGATRSAVASPPPTPAVT